MNIKPLKTDADWRAALARIDELWDAAPGTPAGDELDVLSTLVEAYETARCPMLPPDPIEAIKFRMEQMQLAPADVAPFFGGRNRISEVLNRKRRLTVSMMRRLHKGLGIPADVLLQ
ncbi:MAG: DNA-binding protein [Lentisphaerae bacterium RIFOXYB12_FULL_65_16]|nr:MAG: DNA-binding protein [Lentisphaerae bacterium RIFOXYA12_64_32]OGV93599.1 MAG: DNA-binding protein [Lentisphaerae bacterium RIFOXYB12_FULL_65_16]